MPGVDENGENGLGFTFQSYNADDFLWALKRCLGLYHGNREGFRALQHRDMSQDFSWNVPAGRYMELFYRMLADKQSKRGDALASPLSYCSASKTIPQLWASASSSARMGAERVMPSFSARS